MTLVLLLVAAALPAAAQSPAPRLRGFQIDAARVPESLAHYRRVIDFAAEWGLNAILFRLTDDQGSALRFTSHPELLTHRHAFTAAELRELARYGDAKGVQLIPEIESFGHSRFITGAPEHAALEDTTPGAADGFRGLIPNHPKALAILGDLYREAVGIFTSPYLHGGCDEVNWGGSEYSKKALAKRSRAQIAADHLNALNHLARGLGKEFVIWGDQVLRKDPAILPLLDKSIVIHDWNYWENDPAAVRKFARMALGQGLRVVGGPALGWCKWGPRVGTEQLRNVEAYAEAYRGLDDPRALGVIVTHWLPSRYVVDSLWDAVAYAAVTLTEGAAAARDSAFERFVERHYGAAWDERWADVFRSAYDCTPNRKSCAPAWMGPRLPVPWRSGPELAEALHTGVRNPPPFRRILAQLAACEPGVRRNVEDFRAFRLSLEYLDHLFWRTAALRRALRPPDAGQETLAEWLHAIARRDQEMHAALRANWDRGRPADSPFRGEAGFDYEPEDQIVLRMGEAAAYSAELARDPGRVKALAGR